MRNQKMGETCRIWKTYIQQVGLIGMLIILECMADLVGNKEKGRISKQVF